jgi:VanZ family protein
MLVGAGFALAAVPIGYRPTTAFPHQIEHALFFFAVGASFGCGYAHRYRLVGLLVISLPAAIQLIQAWAPSRHPRLADAVAGMIGAGLGFVTIAGFERFVRSRMAARPCVAPNSSEPGRPAGKRP